jgi:hypothetical protein
MILQAPDMQHLLATMRLRDFFMVIEAEYSLHCRANIACHQIVAKLLFLLVENGLADEITSNYDSGRGL